ncbi:conserved hypothetical protein, partial [Streptomyces pristinaespiralis ATCC 25486]
MSHDQAHYLELLARGAAAESVNRTLLLARAEGAGPEQLAALEHAKQLALRVRAELEGRRRREAELSALFETAHDLAGLRDLDAVLRAIVQRARSLLGTEVAYLSLNDPAAGDTYMRVTEGSVSARFQQVRLGMGEGLGGLVAQTARPYVTESYFDDARFEHTGTIDAAVKDEGLVAILGVPLMLGSQVIGVLFAADRRARVFEREQVALLASFAAHAAVAIDTANLLAETRSALADLERANAIIQDHSGVLERASDVHDRLTELVLRGGGVQDVAAALSEVLDGTVEFTEAGPDTTGSGGHATRHGDDWVAAVAAGGEVFWFAGASLVIKSLTTGNHSFLFFCLDGHLTAPARQAVGARRRTARPGPAARRPARRAGPRSAAAARAGRPAARGPGRPARGARRPHRRHGGGDRHPRRGHRRRARHGPQDRRASRLVDPCRRPRPWGLPRRRRGLRARDGGPSAPLVGRVPPGRDPFR